MKLHLGLNWLSTLQVFVISQNLFVCTECPTPELDQNNDLWYSKFGGFGYISGEILFSVFDITSQTKRCITRTLGKYIISKICAK